MSVKVSTWVRHERPQLIKGNTLLALLTLADLPNGAGECMRLHEEDSSQAARASKTAMSIAQFRTMTKSPGVGVYVVDLAGLRHSLVANSIYLTAIFQWSGFARRQTAVSSASPQHSGPLGPGGHYPY